MARTPVTTETVEKPKRTPVVVEDGETLIEKGATLKELVVASENGAMDAKPRHEVKPIIDGYRECARPDCTASFKPRSLDPKETDATEYYCSDDCAIAEFYRKRNLGPVPEKVVSGASAASSRAHREEKKRERVVKNAEAETKHGPLRAIAEVLATKKGSKRVKYECGHEGSVGSRANRGRCRKCRVGAPVEAERKEKKDGDMAQKVKASTGTGRDSQRRRDHDDQMGRRKEAKEVKRQPVTRATEKKTKRTPVKPPKRGKKGK